MLARSQSLATGPSTPLGGTETSPRSQAGDGHRGFRQVRAFGGGDRSGTPLAMQSAAATVSDHCQILSTAILFPVLGGTPGRPRKHPKTLLAQGIPLDDVQYLAGHADPRSTRFYDRSQKQVTRYMAETIST